MGLYHVRRQSDARFLNILVVVVVVVACSMINTLEYRAFFIYTIHR
jgi:hypothetical protein